jgi:hypothetical protein
MYDGQSFVLSGATCVSDRITFDLLHINGALPLWLL